MYNSKLNYRCDSSSMMATLCSFAYCPLYHNSHRLLFSQCFFTMLLGKQNIKISHSKIENALTLTSLKLMRWILRLCTSRRMILGTGRDNIGNFALCYSFLFGGRIPTSLIIQCTICSYPYKSNKESHKLKYNVM